MEVYMFPIRGIFCHGYMDFGLCHVYSVLFFCFPYHFFSDPLAVQFSPDYGS